MFQSTEKNKHNKDLMIGCIVLVVFVFMLTLSAGAVANAKGMDSMFDVFKSANMNDYLNMLNPVFVISNTSLDSFGLSMFATFIAFAFAGSFYLDGRRRKHDMEGQECGSAHWMVNCADYKKNAPKYGTKAWFKKGEPEEAAKYRNEMMETNSLQNIMFDNVYGISMNDKKTRRNLHTIVVGGSGAGKTRYMVKPNILQMNASYIITDPSGELYRDTSTMLSKNNYDIRVFNTFDTNLSMQYNPLAYINTDADVTTLVTLLIRNTGEAKGDNKYFDDATKQLLTAIILFLVHYCPESERNFSRVMELVVAADVPEEAAKGTQPESLLDKIMQSVRKIDPYGLTLKMWDSFGHPPAKTLKSIISSTTTRLTVFNHAEVERLTCADTVNLNNLGDEKTALYIITPPTENGLGFLVSIMYSQLFNTLYYHATFEAKYLITDEKYISRTFVREEDAKAVYDLIVRQHEHPEEKLIDYEYDMMTTKYKMIEAETGDVLLTQLRQETVDRFKKDPLQFHVRENGSMKAGSPFHVRMLIDEFANINEIPDFEKIVSTIRKYNVSVVIILQSLSQLKKIYEKDYENIIGNCDIFIFLGAKEEGTNEYVSKALGDMTITVRNASDSLGKGKGSSLSYSQSKRAMMTPDEITRMPNEEQLIIIRGFPPFRIPKYALEKHPNFQQCADYDESLIADIELLNLEAKIRAYNEANGIIDNSVDQNAINLENQQTVAEWKQQMETARASAQKESGKVDAFTF